MIWNQLFTGLALALALSAAVTDLRTRKIPNRLTLSALALGPFLHLAHGVYAGAWTLGLKWFGLSLLGIVVCGFFPSMSFARGEMGGGDVKLFAALGALCGPLVGFDAQAFTFLLTLALLLPIRLVRRRMLIHAARNVLVQARNLVIPKPARVTIEPVALPPVPLAPWILLGLGFSLLRNGALV